MIVSSEFSSLNLPISMPSHPRREIPRLRPEPSLREGGNRAGLRSGRQAQKIELQFRGKRQQRDVLRALDGYREPALVTRAGTRHAARKDFAALLNKRRQNLGLLVVDEIDP